MFVFLLTGKRKITPYHSNKRQSVAIARLSPVYITLKSDIIDIGFESFFIC